MHFSYRCKKHGTMKIIYTVEGLQHRIMITSVFKSQSNSCGSVPIGMTNTGGDESSSTAAPASGAAAASTASAPDDTRVKADDAPLATRNMTS